MSELEAMLVQAAASDNLADDDYDWRKGAVWGAGWAFAIIGMAQAIRDQKFCQRCDGELDGYMCCDGCDERW